ncbi:NAD-dependent epimerase/dehydratase family protein, partial [Rhizobium johnstonii]
DEPLTIYAATKKSMELMAHSYSHLHKIPTTAFRFFTVYGPWGRPDIALFKFTKNMLEGQPRPGVVIPIQPWGGTTQMFWDSDL